MFGSGIEYTSKPTPRPSTFTILGTLHKHRAKKYTNWSFLEKKFLQENSKKIFFFYIGRFIYQNVQNQILRNF